MTRGMTVADFWGVTDREANAHYLRHGNTERYYDLLTERISKLP